MNTCEEIPYEELNSIQVRVCLWSFLCCGIIIYVESQRSTWQQLLFERGFLQWTSGGGGRKTGFSSPRDLREKRCKRDDSIRTILDEEGTFRTKRCHGAHQRIPSQRPTVSLMD